MVAPKLPAENNVAKLRSAFVEFYAGMMRLSHQPDAKHGDPFEISIGLRWLKNNVIELTAVDKPIPPSSWRLIVQSLRDIGADEIVFTRKRNDREEHKRINVKRFVRTR